MKNIAKTAALAWRYLWSRPLAAALNLLLLTLGLAAITLVLLVSTQLDQAFERDLSGIDLVVGAKGSPLQLILAGVFHIDVPTGNIPLQEAQDLAQNPLVSQVIPLSLGDSYQGFRIVGTTPDYTAHYRAELAQGGLWQQPMDAVLGATVARSIVAPSHTGAPLVGATFIDHPLYPTARAKLGFDRAALEAYGPESQQPFQLRWLALPRHLVQEHGRGARQGPADSMDCAGQPGQAGLERPTAWPTFADVGLA
eukprot:gene45144-56207_t